MLIFCRSADLARAMILSDCSQQQILNLELPCFEDAVRQLCVELEDVKGEQSQSIQNLNTPKAGELVLSLGRLPFSISQAASFANQSSKDLDYVLRLCLSEHKLQY